MSQKRRHSFLEACLSTAIGFVVSFILNFLVMATVFSIHLDVRTNILVTCIFTVASIARGYGVRRLFNYLHLKGYL